MAKKRLKNDSVLGLAWYKPEDYQRLKEMFSDGSELPETYEKWLHLAEKVIKDFKKLGQSFQRVYIEPDQFPGWCADNGLDIDGKARARFVAETVQRRNTGR